MAWARQAAFDQIAPGVMGSMDGPREGGLEDFQANQTFTCPRDRDVKYQRVNDKDVLNTEVDNVLIQGSAIIVMLACI
jgi:hypothetical protein